MFGSSKSRAQHAFLGSRFSTELVDMSTLDAKRLEYRNGDDGYCLSNVGIDVALHDLHVLRDIKHRRAQKIEKHMPFFSPARKSARHISSRTYWVTRSYRSCSAVGERVPHPRLTPNPSEGGTIKVAHPRAREPIWTGAKTGTRTPGLRITSAFTPIIDNTPQQGTTSTLQPLTTISFLWRAVNCGCFVAR